MWEKGFVVFAEFQQTVKLFPINFIGAILSTSKCAKCCQKLNSKSITYTMIKSSKLQNFSPVSQTFIFYGITLVQLLPAVVTKTLTYKVL